MPDAFMRDGGVSGINKDMIPEILEIKKHFSDLNRNNIPQIVTDKQQLKIPTQSVSIDEGKEIANKLFQLLTDEYDGWGLSANQIGIQKSVCVVNVQKPYYFINPRIVDSDGEFLAIESCLSFPDKTVLTLRKESITIECDNYDGQLHFDISDEVDKSMNNPSVLEMIVIQHEISHLEGKTMFDFQRQPQQVENKIGRNDKVLISNGKEELIIKYKKFVNFENNGYSIIKVM